MLFFFCYHTAIRRKQEVKTMMTWFADKINAIRKRQEIHIFLAERKSLRM